MAKINVNDSSAVQVVVDHVKAERKASRKVTCKSLLLNALGYTHEEIDAKVVNTVRSFIDNGTFPNLKLIQKAGIVTSDYRLNSEVKAEESVAKRQVRLAKKEAALKDKAEKKVQRELKKAEKEAAKKSTDTAASNDNSTVAQAS